MDKERVIVSAVVLLMMMTHEAMALKFHSPANVLPSFQTSTGLQVKLFDAFGDGLYFPRRVMFKYVYIKHVGGSPLTITSIEVSDCLFLENLRPMPLFMEAGQRTGFITFRKGARVIYPCKPSVVTIRTNLGTVEYRF